MSAGLGKKLSVLSGEMSLQELTANIDYFYKWTQTKNIKADEHDKAWIGLAKIIYESCGDKLKSIEPHIQVSDVVTFHEGMPAV